MASKSVEQFKQGHERDRQTDHAMEQCVAIGGIACAATAINNNKEQMSFYVTQSLNNWQVTLQWQIGNYAIAVVVIIIIINKNKNTNSDS